MNDVPDFVYFNHSIHIHKGVGCVTLPRAHRQDAADMAKGQTLQMEWCLECHRNPAQYVRPREQVFKMDWQPPRISLRSGPSS